MYNVIASQVTQVSSEDAELIWKFVYGEKEDSEARQLRARHSQDQFTANIVKMKKDPENKRMNNLMKQYVDRAL